MSRDSRSESRRICREDIPQLAMCPSSLARKSGHFHTRLYIGKFSLLTRSSHGKKHMTDTPEREIRGLPFDRRAWTASLIGDLRRILFACPGKNVIHVVEKGPRVNSPDSREILPLSQSPSARETTDSKTENSMRSNELFVQEFLRPREIRGARSLRFLSSRPLAFIHLRHTIILSDRFARL